MFFVESGGLASLQRNTSSPANAKFPSLALRGLKTKNPAQVDLAGFLSLNPLRNFAFDRGVGRVRTAVQTGNSIAFYTFICQLVFVQQPVGNYQLLPYSRLSFTYSSRP